MGLLAGISAFLIATSLFLWMSPTILGLVLAIPISWMSGQLAAGLALKRLGLLMTPEEHTPPPIVVRANTLQTELTRLGIDDTDALVALHGDETLRRAHEAMLPTPPHRARGHIDPDRALAQAKLVDAETLEEAIAWLKPKERMVVLHDRALLDILCRLRRAGEPASA
jgi:membrane glycosyltransferase